MAVLKIIHGGRIRLAVPVPAEPTSGTTRAAREFWDKGSVLELQTDGVAKTANTPSANSVYGIAFETRTESTDAGLGKDETKGSGKVSMILDPAVIETDVYASGLKNWEENQNVFTNTSGKLDNVDAGSAVKLGKCLSPIQSDSTVRIFWTPQY